MLTLRTRWSDRWSGATQPLRKTNILEN
uniref:Uncharacterized protein n=1 Tax=Rhizophora mucronata TaxID=61149 RepID=A0A2P2QBI0_RHIMU